MDNFIGEIGKTMLSKHKPAKVKWPWCVVGIWVLFLMSLRSLHTSHIPFKAKA